MIAGKWIAGPTEEDAIERGERFKKLGIGAILNYLGEAFTDQSDIDDAVNSYLKIIDKIENGDDKMQISVKPTQIGLALNKEITLKNLLKIIEKAKEKNIFVWIDMEESNYVDSTIEIYLEALKSYKETGLCMQAYLKRTYDDVVKVSSNGGVIRLVKGAYTESEEIAFKNKDEINKNYIKILELLFEKSERFMVASHDELMIEKARELSKKTGKKIWFGMLNGIRNEYLIKLKDEGETTFSYIPYGRRWIQYSYRRMQEAGHISLIMKSLLHSKKI
ncbi:proline dehydrogenase family protein [Caldiplasma sukawensis]